LSELQPCVVMTDMQAHYLHALTHTHIYFASQQLVSCCDLCSLLGRSRLARATLVHDIASLDWLPWCWWQGVYVVDPWRPCLQSYFDACLIKNVNVLGSSLCAYSVHAHAPRRSSDARSCRTWGRRWTTMRRATRRSGSGQKGRSCEGPGWAGGCWRAGVVR
jgi:hypothetical protein